MDPAYTYRPCRNKVMHEQVNISLCWCRGLTWTSE